MSKPALFGFLVYYLSMGTNCGGGGSELKQGRCLSDAEICQFQRGVTTKQQVQSKLGNAQQYLGAEVWAYSCQQVNGQVVVHNDLVVFDFSDAGVLIDITVLRQGSAATPPPACSS